MRAWYRRYIERYLFRKLLFWITVVLIMVFLSLWLLIKSRFYSMLEDREQQLLDVRTQQFGEYLTDTITRFNEQIRSFYTEDTLYDDELMPRYRFLADLPIEPENNYQYLQENYFGGLLNGLRKNLPEASLLMLYRAQDQARFIDHDPRTAPLDQINDTFFNGFQKGIRYPYLGTIPSSEETASTISYIVSPIFHLQSQDNPIVAYMLLTFDTDALIRAFSTDNRNETRIIVRYQDHVWLDSSAGSELEANTISRTIRIPSQELEITSYKYKQRIDDDLSSIQMSTSIILCLALITCILLIANLQNLTVRRLIQLGRHFNKVHEEPFLVPLKVRGNDEISQLVSQFNEMTAQLKTHIRLVYIAQLQKRDAEYYSLKMQINPHFLYNTLESIRMLAVIHDQPVISEKLHSMGQLYRWILKTDSDLIPVEEELRYTELYIQLCTMGYSSIICLNIEMDPDIRHCKLLKFSLQPLIENAIKHGQLDTVESPEITIALRQEGSNLIIDISNNGIGLESEELDRLQTELLTPRPLDESRHIGIRNVHERIRSFYGDDYGLTLLRLRKNEGFGLSICIPIDRRETDIHD